MSVNGEVVVRVTGVKKSFRLPHEQVRSVKGLFINMFRKNRTFEKQKVLRGITLEVKKGEFFGIVGRNGGGKSTLLKLLAEIYVPDEGSIEINGKITPFIELGVGFNPELTGRENVYLNGALLGFSKAKIDEIYDDIVSFAELERFMDQKLKNYSSGMQVRLAFSVAIQARTEILLIDEVLAVGDSNFQQKCFDIFDTFKEEGRTIIFISHSMSMVTKFCDRAVLLNGGKIIAEGEPEVVAAEYEMLNNDMQKDNTSRLEIKNRREAHIIETVLDNYKPEDQLLELGAGNGRHVELISSMGIKTLGIDRIEASSKPAKKYIYKDIKDIAGLSDITGLLVLDNRKSIDGSYLEGIFKRLEGKELANVRKIYVHLPFHVYQAYRESIDMMAPKHLANPLDISLVTDMLRNYGFAMVSGGVYGADYDAQYAEVLYERFDIEKQRKIWQFSLS